MVIRYFLSGYPWWFGVVLRESLMFFLLAVLNRVATGLLMVRETIPKIVIQCSDLDAEKVGFSIKEINMTHFNMRVKRQSSTEKKILKLRM